MVAKPDSIAKFKELSQLSMASYAFGKNLLPPDNLVALLQHLSANSGLTINALLSALNFATPLGVRSLLWLWKFDLIEVHPAKV